jgi:hypothetical protein
MTAVAAASPKGASQISPDVNNPTQTVEIFSLKILVASFFCCYFALRYFLLPTAFFLINFFT